MKRSKMSIKTASEQTGAEDDRPHIMVGCDDYTPFSYMDVDGNMTGIDVELAREAFDRIGYQADFTFINWEDKKKLLKDGSIDCVWSSFTMDGRETEYKWAGPYMKSKQVVAVNGCSSEPERSGAVSAEFMGGSISGDRQYST